jgi:predicted  nucleic acid-binding Zn-ribbon protein
LPFTTENLFEPAMQQFHQAAAIAAAQQGDLPALQALLDNRLEKGLYHKLLEYLREKNVLEQFVLDLRDFEGRLLTRQLDLGQVSGKFNFEAFQREHIRAFADKRTEVIEKFVLIVDEAVAEQDRLLNFNPLTPKRKESLKQTFIAAVEEISNKIDAGKSSAANKRGSLEHNLVFWKKNLEEAQRQLELQKIVVKNIRKEKNDTENYLNFLKQEHRERYLNFLETATNKRYNNIENEFDKLPTRYEKLLTATTIEDLAAADWIIPPLPIQRWLLT